MTELQRSELGPVLVYLVSAEILTIEQAYALRRHDDLCERLADGSITAEQALRTADERSADEVTE